MVNVLIVGGGFAGLNAAKGLGGVPDVEVTIVDKSNHHLFQPLLYQVAMAGLSPADIAVPIRSYHWPQSSNRRSREYQSHRLYGLDDVVVGAYLLFDRI